MRVTPRRRRRYAVDDERVEVELRCVTRSAFMKDVTFGLIDFWSLFLYDFVDDAESSFDGLVSTSNHIASDEVHITTTQPIWWCMEVKHSKS